MNRSLSKMRRLRVQKPHRSDREITVFRCQRVKCGHMTTLETKDTTALKVCDKCGGPVKPVFRGLNGDDAENEL